MWYHILKSTSWRTLLEAQWIPGQISSRGWGNHPKVVIVSETPQKWPKHSGLGIFGIFCSDGLVKFWFFSTFRSGDWRELPVGQLPPDSHRRDRSGNFSRKFLVRSKKRMASEWRHVVWKKPVGICPSLRILTPQNWLFWGPNPCYRGSNPSIGGSNDP